MKIGSILCLCAAIPVILTARPGGAQDVAEDGTYYLFPNVPFVISVPAECTSWYMGATKEDQRYKSNPLMFFRKGSKGLPFISIAVDYYDDQPEDIKKAWKDPARILRWKAGEGIRYESSALPDTELLKEEMIQVNGLPANSSILRSQKSQATYHYISILFATAIVQIGINASTSSFEADERDFMRIVHTIRCPDLPFEISFPAGAGIWKALAVPTAQRLERNPFNLFRRGGQDLPKIASLLDRYEQAAPQYRQLWGDPPRLLKTMMQNVIEGSKASGFQDLEIVKEEMIEVNGAPALSCTFRSARLASTYHYVGTYFPTAYLSMMLFSKSEEFTADDAEFMLIVRTIKKK